MTAKWQPAGSFKPTAQVAHGKPQGRGGQRQGLEIRRGRGERVDPERACCRRECALDADHGGERDEELGAVDRLGPLPCRLGPEPEVDDDRALGGHEDVRRAQ